MNTINKSIKEAITYALLRKKRIMKLLFPVPVGAENIEKIDVEQVDVLEHLYENSALTIGMENIPNAEFYNILYNSDLILLTYCKLVHLIRDKKCKFVHTD
jgi:hypothetical protein